MSTPSQRRSYPAPDTDVRNVRQQLLDSLDRYGQLKLKYLYCPDDDVRRELGMACQEATMYATAMQALKRG